MASDHHGEIYHRSAAWYNNCQDVTAQVNVFSLFIIIIIVVIIIIIMVSVCDRCVCVCVCVWSAVQDERQKTISTEPVSDRHVTTTFTTANTSTSTAGAATGPATATGTGGGGGGGGAYIATSTTTITSSGLHASVLLEAELAAESTDIDATEFADLTSDDSAVLCDAVDKHLLMLVDWARRLPQFTQLPLADQVTLLRSGHSACLAASLPSCLSACLHVCLAACFSVSQICVTYSSRRYFYLQHIK